MSQLPVVDLGDDFDLLEENLETDNLNNLMNENKDNGDEKKKQMSLEAWSKGHVLGLKVKIFGNLMMFICKFWLLLNLVLLQLYF